MSLELAFESSLAGNCDQGYSCVYVNTFSWRTPTMPLPMENNPRVVFERMFGDGGTVEQRLDQLRKDRSVLDSMTAELRKLQRQLGSSDRTTVSGYLEAIRDVEQRIQKAEASSASTPLPETMQPAGIPESFPEHAQLMVDLMFLAYQADVTRVITPPDLARAGGPAVPVHRRAGGAPPDLASSRGSAPDRGQHHNPPDGSVIKEHPSRERQPGPDYCRGSRASTKVRRSAAENCATARLSHM